MEDAMKDSWEMVGTIAPNELEQPRLELHYATRLLASATSSLLDSRDDDSQTAMAYDRASQSFVSEEFQGNGNSVRLALALDDLKLSLISLSVSTNASLSLVGQTLDAALKWVDAELSRVLKTSQSVKLRQFPDFPDHPLARGAKFTCAPAESYTELRRYYQNASQLLSDNRMVPTPGSPVQVWPHHFDIARLIKVSAPDTIETFIGVGLSPGDHYYQEPYFYVSPWWKEPDPTKIVLNGPGHVRTSGWQGAVLTASEILSSDDQQLHLVRNFLATAIAEWKKELELH
jgi:hypothetical protein